MKKKWLIGLGSILGVLLLITMLCHTFKKTNLEPNEEVSSAYKKKVRFEAVPTIYLHGYGAGARSTASMIAYAQQYNGAHKVLTARISASGKVDLRGSWPRATKRPLIQVILQDNKNSNYYTTREWLYNLILLLKQKYHIKHYNTVAHSMGNIMTLAYQLKYGKDSNLPRLKKQVNLGAPFNGIIGIDEEPNHNYLLKNGRPKYMTQSYKYFLKHRHSFPNNVSILNIFGNKEDGTNSDDDVSCVSAQSLRYLLRGKGKYHEIEIKGANGQHSKLHENYKVDQIIGNFLWSN